MVCPSDQHLATGGFQPFLALCRQKMGYKVLSVCHHCPQEVHRYLQYPRQNQIHTNLHPRCLVHLISSISLRFGGLAAREQHLTSLD